VVSNRIISKPQLNIRRSRISLQRLLPSSDVSLEKRISALELNVALLAKSTNKEADLEKKAQRDYEKDVKKQEENKLRSGEEKQLEKKLSKSILSPVEREGRKAGGILGKLKSFFMILLGGWLTNRGFAALEAYAEGDTEQLNSIASEVGKTLAIVGGIFLALNVGILGIVGTIGKIALAITLAPFRFAINRIGDFFKGKSTPKPTAPKPTKPKLTTPKPSGKPGKLSPFQLEQQRKASTQQNMLKNQTTKGGIKDFISNTWNRVKGIASKAPGRAFGFLTNTFSAAGKIPIIGGPARALGKTFRFFGNLLGKVGPGLGKIAGNIAKKSLGFLQIFLTADEVIGRLRQGMSPAQALVPVLVRLATTSAGSGLGAAVGSVLPIAGTGLGYLAGTGLGYWLGDWFKNLMDSNWSKDWDNLPGLKNLNELGSVFGMGKNKSVSGEETITSAKSPSDSISTPNKPAAKVSNSTGAMSSPPKPVSGGGNTTVVYKKVRGSGGAMGQAPLKTGSATDVPLISSENPSNFYTMYSQLLYNVVI